MTEATWHFNPNWQHWSLIVNQCEMITLIARPASCDRGRWYAKPVGLKARWISPHHGFPRYYMDLDRAKLELSEWLAWKSVCEGTAP